MASRLSVHSSRFPPHGVQGGRSTIPGVLLPAASIPRVYCGRTTRNGVFIWIGYKPHHKPSNQCHSCDVCEEAVGYGDRFAETFVCSFWSLPFPLPAEFSSFRSIFYFKEDLARVNTGLTTREVLGSPFLPL